jgi:hypothetical protein
VLGSPGPHRPCWASPATCRIKKTLTPSSLAPIDWHTTSPLVLGHTAMQVLHSSQRHRGADTDRGLACPQS